MGLFSTIQVMLGPGGREIVRLHRDLDGMLSLKEAAWLYRHAAGRRLIVEIGSYRGKSAVIMARGSLFAGGPSTRIVAIDPHMVGDDSPRFGFNHQDREVLVSTLHRYGVESNVQEMVMTSREALASWDGSLIDLLWVDGDHSYEAAHFDLKAWGALVRPGGIIAGHDYKPRFPGVIKAWDELITASRGWGPTQKVRSLVWAVRTKVGSPVAAAAKSAAASGDAHATP